MTCPCHTPKPSDYIQCLERGEGTTTGSTCAAADVLQAGALEAFVRDVDEERIELEEVEIVGRKLEGIEWAMRAETMEGLEPCNVEEARQCLDWLSWNAAIKDELARMHKLKTWTLIDRPPNTNVVGSKWVFKLKQGASSKIVKYKVCLVAQGFTQVPGLDYGDTFALVTKLMNIQILLALAARFDWEIY
ncbi:hypothetical protein HETIRDRAFT_452675 [Heterobasidion irregulare TC 32-1]|uniref:Reverse transcriptase Ty1/copia-type domain-containing protein n=1 Tax=Heterobasidion irregulare (strain TC 32-1) TaxID=747525 RepID=W4K2F2_HETIT|nr:uncharacterized protein HETIRDRAFT_452675 [Heterobasidion irregulare TC 32-1]ETW79525.1 hypothetical protein HETIRDRAFT_452675 [Heterobasidion irregulare TC 32-1]